MTHDSKWTEARIALRFAGKVLAVVAGFVLALLIVRASFAFSKWVGFSVIGMIIVSLYVSVHRWLLYLPGLLVFGVLNSVVVLVTGHSPTNPTVLVSPALAFLVVTFYAVGFLLSCWYDASRISALDRCAWLMYFSAMILPGFTADSNLGQVTPTIASLMVSGMAAIIFSFAIHRAQQKGNGLGKARLERGP